MVVFTVTLPDTGFDDLTLEVDPNSLVSDLLDDVTAELQLERSMLECRLEGDLLCETRSLRDLLLNTELQVCKKQIWSKSCFEDKTMREELLLRLVADKEKHVKLNTPTFLCNDILEIDSGLIPAEVKRISFCNSNSDVEAIGNSFLSNCSSIIELDLSGMTGVTKIGGGFLNSCSSITALNLPGMNGVTEIGDEFLSCCSSITALDLSDMKGVTKIGTWFLNSCSSITALDLSGMNGVTGIGGEFLNSCSSITALDLSGMNGVTKIGTWFLNRCSSITALDLSGMKGVTEIGSGFLKRCYSITALDLSGMNGVTGIDAFLCGCSSITALDLSGMNGVTEIGDEFVSGCSSIEALDLSGMKGVTEIGTWFLNNCSSITALDLSGMNGVTKIGTWFLNNCSSITALDLSDMNGVTEIGGEFLNSCSSITALDLSGMNGVTKIGTGFLNSCSSITALDLSGMNGVTEIGGEFLNSCSSITALDLSGMNGVTKIGGAFLRGCSLIVRGVEIKNWFLRELISSLRDVKLIDPDNTPPASQMYPPAKWRTYDDIQQSINKMLETAGEGVSNLESKSRELEQAKKAIEDIHKITADMKKQNSDTSILSDNYELVRKLLEDDELGTESQILYLITSTAAMDEKDEQLQIEFTRQLSQKVHKQIRVEANNLQLCQFSDTAWVAENHDLKNMISLWKVASNLHISHKLDKDTDDPAVIFMEGFLREFRYHFQGDLPTADPSKPEWVLEYSSRVMENHWELFKVLEPACSEGHRPEDLFFNTVIATLASHLYECLQSDTLSDYHFSECIASVTTFESLLSSFNIPAEIGLAKKLFTQACIDRWLQIERAALNLVLTTSRSDTDAWTLSTPVSLLAFDDLRVAKCILNFYSAVNGLCKKLCKARVSNEVISNFNTIIVKGLELLAGDIRELVSCGTTDNNFISHIISSNSLEYLQLCIGTWLLDPILCECTDYSELTDLLSIHQTACVRDITAFCCSPVCQSTYEMITETVGGVLKIRMDLHVVQSRLKILKLYATDKSFLMIRDMSLSNIELYVTTKLLSVTESSCRIGLLYIIVATATAVDGACHVISDMLSLLSLPSEQQKNISKPVSQSVLNGLRLKSISPELATEILSETFDDQLNNAGTVQDDLNDTDSEDWR